MLENSFLESQQAHRTLPGWTKLGLIQYCIDSMSKKVTQVHDDRNIGESGDLKSCSGCQIKKHRANKRWGKTSFLVQDKPQEIKHVGRFLWLP